MSHDDRRPGSLDVVAVMLALTRRRPLFHSEADLQHELAWQIHLEHPTFGLRLEAAVSSPTRPGRREQLDIAVRTEQGLVALEVKYLKDDLVADVDGERFTLLRQGAQDIRAYDVVKDIHRVEHAVSSGTAWAGAVLVLTNDPSYWSPPTHGRPTGAAAFRLYDGSVLTGTRAWGSKSGPGTRKGREDDLVIVGTHTLAWRDYSVVDGAGHGRFRFLLLNVDPPSRPTTPGTARPWAPRLTSDDS